MDTTPTPPPFLTQQDRDTARPSRRTAPAQAAGDAPILAVRRAVDRLHDAAVALMNEHLPEEALPCEVAATDLRAAFGLPPEPEHGGGYAPPPALATAAPAPPTESDTPFLQCGYTWGRCCGSSFPHDCRVSLTTVDSDHRHECGCCLATTITPALATAALAALTAYDAAVRRNASDTWDTVLLVAEDADGEALLEVLETAAGAHVEVPPGVDDDAWVAALAPLVTAYRGLLAREVAARPEPEPRRCRACHWPVHVVDGRTWHQPGYPGPVHEVDDPLTGRHPRATCPYPAGCTGCAPDPLGTVDDPLVLAHLGPVRSCCGQRHVDLPCPDGLVTCCLCFGRFPVSELHEPTPGYPEDVCRPCAAQEAAR